MRSYQYYYSYGIWQTQEYGIWQTQEYGIWQTQEYGIGKHKNMRFLIKNKVLL